jgi:1,6-anhydro-N-acetylmuramate kinase
LEGAGPHYAVGLLSGTSHDGVSAAMTVIDERKRPRVRLIAFETYPYPAKLRARLQKTTAGAETGAGELSQLNFALARRWPMRWSRLRVARESRSSASASSARVAIRFLICRYAASVAERRRRRYQWVNRPSSPRPPASR